MLISSAVLSNRPVKLGSLSVYSETVYVRAGKIKPISPSPRNKVGTYVSQAFACTN